MKFCLLWIITLMTVRLLPCSFQAIFIQSSTKFCGLKANCVIWACDKSTARLRRDVRIFFDENSIRNVANDVQLLNHQLMVSFMQLDYLDFEKSINSKYRDEKWSSNDRHQRECERFNDDCCLFHLNSLQLQPTCFVFLF